jgi:iron(III) transport system ATP-binding protein
MPRGVRAAGPSRRALEVGAVAEEAQPYLSVRGVTKLFDGFRALDDVSFGIERGEFVCFLGPSGCGKTTLLRCIAGLETQSEGAIVQGGRDISWLPPSGRDFGIVFQSYALFPNLDVRENVAFGLVNQRRPRADVAARVAELIALVGLGGQEHKYPGQLSGGQQQRVALARALAPSPGLLLLDEPLSALDAKVRARLRREVRKLHERLGVTTVMVTHDQEEALTMADRVLVMNAGRVEQIGSPGEIYDHPASSFVADFVGVMNFLPGLVHDRSTVRCGESLLVCDHGDLAPGASVLCAVRPEQIEVDERLDGPNVLEATISETEHLGPFLRLYLRVPDLTHGELRADVRRNGDGLRQLTRARRVSLSIPAAGIRVYPGAENR